MRYKFSNYVMKGLFTTKHESIQYRFLTASMRNSIWQAKTGSRIDRNKISSSNAMFLKVAYTMKHRPRVKTISVYAKCNIADEKPEVEITFVTL